MKLLFEERPSVRNWLVFWGIGFVTIFLLGELLCVALWLIGQGDRLSGPPHSQLILFPLGHSLRIVPLVAAGFGVYLATAMVFQFRRQERVRRESAVRVGGFHPLVGQDEHAPFTKSWQSKQTLITGQPVMLSGQGAGPTDAEADRWQRFQARCEALLRAATDDFLRPGNPYEGCPVVTLPPWAVQLQPDGALEVYFEVDTDPEHFPAATEREVDPRARFTPELALEKTEWS